MSGLRTTDLGNNETVSRGMVRDGDGWLALNGVESKAFKTERGAVAWLARRGLRADGSKVRPGLDHGIERNAFGWSVFMLPRRENRYGHELRCEVVYAEGPNVQRGHGYGAGR